MFNSKLKARIAQLEAELADSKQKHAETSERLRSARQVLTQVSEEFDEKSLPISHKKLTRLVFTAMTPDGLRRSEWTLGLGPCGKTVAGLEFVRGDDTVVIKQFHTDGSHKLFTYKIHDIVGRVQECYELSETTPSTYWHERVREQLARARLMSRRHFR